MSTKGNISQGSLLGMEYITGKKADHMKVTLKEAFEKGMENGQKQTTQSMKEISRGT